MSPVHRDLVVVWVHKPVPIDLSLDPPQRGVLQQRRGLRVPVHPLPPRGVLHGLPGEEHHRAVEGGGDEGVDQAGGERFACVGIVWEVRGG